MPYPYFGSDQGAVLVDQPGDYLAAQLRRRYPGQEQLLNPQGVPVAPLPAAREVPLPTAGMAAREVPLPMADMAAREVPARPVFPAQPAPPMPATAPSGLAAAAPPVPAPAAGPVPYNVLRGTTPSQGVFPAPAQSGAVPAPPTPARAAAPAAKAEPPLTAEEEQQARLPPLQPGEAATPNEAALVRMMMGAPNVAAAAGPIPGLPPGYTPRTALDYLKEWRDFKAARGPAPRLPYTVAGQPGGLERWEQAWNKDTWDAFMAFKALEAQRLAPMLKMEEIKGRERVAEIGERTKQKILEESKGLSGLSTKLATTPGITGQQIEQAVANYKLAQGLMGKPVPPTGPTTPPLPGGITIPAPGAVSSAQEAMTKALGEEGHKIVAMLKPTEYPATSKGAARSVQQFADPVEALLAIQRKFKPGYVQQNMRYIAPYLESIYTPEQFRQALAPNLGSKGVMGLLNFLLTPPAGGQRRVAPFQLGTPLREQVGEMTPEDIAAQQLRSYYPPGRLPWEAR